MGRRYHRSVKIGKHVRVNYSTHGRSVSVGHGPLTLNFGKNGIRATSTNPITHVSTSTMLTSKKSHTKRASTARPVSGNFDIHLDQDGNIRIVDGRGNQVTDQSTLRKIKATPQYKAVKQNLEQQRQQRMGTILIWAGTLYFVSCV